jgi:acetyl esterase/lipase
MLTTGRMRTTAVVACVSLLVVACGSTPAPPGASPSPSPAADVTLPTATATPTTAPSPTPTSAPSSAPSATPAAVAVTRDIPYQSGNPRLVDGLLDVYAPAKPGPYPVVVMLHGGPGIVTKGWSGSWAAKIAEQGYVVFAPTWGMRSTEGKDLPQDQQVTLQIRQAACGVAYARTHAAEYGGHPSTLVVFGHSGGANAGSVIAFGGAPPVDGCAGGDTVGSISSLVTYEGDWLLMDTMWRPSIPKQVAAAATPWEWLSSDTRLPVVMLVSEGSGGVVEPPAVTPAVDWKTARDPIALRAAFRPALTDADGAKNIGQEQAVLYAALKAQGNPVSLTEVPGADHMTVGMSMPVVLAAIAQAAGR